MSGGVIDVPLQVRCVVTLRCLVLAMAFGFVASTASADTITLSALDAGRYTNAGDHDPNSTSINIQTFLGSASGNEWRNWFVFDLSSVVGTIQLASLQLETSVIFRQVEFLDPPIEPITYTLFDVSTPISNLTGGGTGKTTTFADLGTGVALGSRQLTEADANQVESVSLNAAGLSLIQQSLGSQFAIGGASTNFMPDRMRLLAFTEGPRQLILEVPEPSSLLLGAVGIAGVSWFRRRRSAF